MGYINNHEYSKTTLQALKTANKGTRMHKQRASTKNHKESR